MKNAAGVDTAKFAKNIDLANLKSDADKLNILIDKLIDTDKLKNVPTNWSNLKNKEGKWDVDKLVAYFCWFK